MFYFETWADALRTSLLSMWFRFTDILPSTIGAIIIFIIGYAIAIALGSLATRAIAYSRAHLFMQKSGIHEDAQKMGVSGTVADWVGSLVKWVIIVITLLVVAETLNIPQLSEFIQRVLLYIPQIIIAIVILGIGIVGSRFLHDIALRGSRAAQLTETSSEMLAEIAKWSIIIFAGMAALIQLGIAVSLIEIMFTGLVAMIAIAGGLAFGLGAKDKARDWLDRVGDQLRNTYRSSR